jgi:septal ring factor EnvC (AmiA/AmiB activator)
LLQRTEAEKQSINQQLAALSDQAKDLRQLLEKLTPKPKANPHGRPQPPSSGGSFTLKAPVAGNLIHGYGVRDADGVTTEGLTYAALPGSPVVAPQAGKIVFAGPFRGYGRIVILQHDGGYHSFLAGFARIDAEMGQEVAAGEPLGVLPAKTGTRPELYFEWRHNNEPVDPGPGLK